MAATGRLGHRACARRKFTPSDRPMEEWPGPETFAGRDKLLDNFPLS